MTDRGKQPKSYELAIPVKDELDFAIENGPFEKESDVITTGILFIADRLRRGETQEIDEIYRKLKDITK